MSRMHLRRAFTVLLAVLLLAVLFLIAASSQAAARPGTKHQRPWKVAYTGSYGPGTHTWCGRGLAPGQMVGHGTATHLGSVSIETRDCTNPMTGEITDGVVTYTAANGDQLYGTYIGQILAPNPDGSVPVTVTGWYDGGTGRFTNATGEAVEQGLVFPISETAGAIEASLTGAITYDAKDRGTSGSGRRPPDA